MTLFLLLKLGNKGKSDNDQLEYAISEQRTILTFNSKDFIIFYNDFYSENKKHYGIIVSSQCNFKETYRCVIKLLNSVTAENMMDAIVFLNDWK